MFLTPSSKIQIGKITIGESAGIESLEIDSSVKELLSKSTIKLPRNFLKKDGKGILDVIKVGDEVQIDLGYNGNIVNEFSGYISKINDSTPVVLECENEWHQYKKDMLEPKTFKSVKLKTLLSYCMPGYVIDCPDVSIPEYIIDKVSKYTAIDSIRQSVGFFTKVDIINKILTCYYPYDFKTFNTHTYIFGTRNEKKLLELRQNNQYPNVRKSDLTFERADDTPIKITAISKRKSGKDLKVVVGSKEKDAKSITRNYYNISTEAELKSTAEKELKTLIYNGYKGSITGFGNPKTAAGDSIKIVDKENPERDGEYLIESVKLSYGVGIGFSRKNTISYKIG